MTETESHARVSPSALAAAAAAIEDAPWWLLREAVASVAMSGQADVGTYTFDDVASNPGSVCRCGRSLPCRHCGPSNQTMDEQAARGRARQFLADLAGLHAGDLLDPAMLTSARLRASRAATTDEARAQVERAYRFLTDPPAS